MPPFPQELGEVLERRYVAGTGDWYARTAAGWYWYDADARTWNFLPLGPLY